MSLPRRLPTSCMCSALLAGVCAYAQTVALSVEPVNVRQQGTITFSVFNAGIARPPATADLVTADMDNDTVGVRLDLNSVQPGRFSSFSADVYVDEHNSPTSTKFVITGSPVGPFLDVDDRITVHVRKGTSDSKGYVNIPLHSGGQVDLISYDAPKDPVDVALGQQRGPDLAIKSKLENLKLVVTGAAINYGCRKCWSPTGQEFQPLTISENGTAAVALPISPNPLQALAASALTVKPAQPHDTVTVDLTYHSAYGGQERKQSLAIPVRFSPNIWLLAVAVLIGAVLGFLTRLVLDKTSRSTRQAALGALARAVVLSVVADIVALVLASSGSKVVVFGFDLDPRQFMPTIVIALLVSGGATVVAAVRSVFGR